MLQYLNKISKLNFLKCTYWNINLTLLNNRNSLVETIIFLLLLAVDQFSERSGRVQKLFLGVTANSSEYYPLSKFACLSTTLFLLYS